MLLTYQGAPGDLIRAAVDAGARGHRARHGRRRDERHAERGVRYASERKVVVVRTTRTGSGRIMGGPSRGRSRARTARRRTPRRRPVFQSIAGEDLAPIKARILLMLALTRTSEPREIQRMFLEY